MILLNWMTNHLFINLKLKIMPGHGTMLSTSSGQDTASIAIDNTGGASGYDVGTQAAVNYTGSTVNAGDVVETEWDSEKEELQITRASSRATGNVNEEGTSLTITDSGDTALSGTISISTKNGENEGYAGASGVTCGNVDGDASFLAE